MRHKLETHQESVCVDVSCDGGVGGQGWILSCLDRNTIYTNRVEIWSFFATSSQWSYKEA